MANDNRAEIFLFTSFQGGSGKTTAAYRFAQAYRDLTGKTGVYFEKNFFCPSSIIDQLNLKDHVKASFMDYFMTNWSGFRADDIASTFTSQENLYILPFTGVRSKDPLQARFSFNEPEAELALKHLFQIFTNKYFFIVIDLPLSFTPLPLFLLGRSDVIFYLFNNQPNSVSFAKQYLQECENRKPILAKTILLRNSFPADKGSPEKPFYEPEMTLPAFALATGKEDAYDQAMKKLAEKALTLPAASLTEKPETGIEPSQIEKLREYQRKLRAEVVATLEKRFGLSDHELKKKVEQNIETAFQKFPPPLINGCDAKAETRRFLNDEILGLGPLEELMRDPDVDEIMVNGPGKIFVERKGQLFLTDRTFNNADHVRAVIDRILMPVGRTVNERTPFVDARLSDGSRVHAIIPPLALTGPMLTIRRFSRAPYTVDDLIFRFKTLSQQVADFLKLCVKLKKNIIVSGGAGSGKTTFLNILSTFISSQERVICIEDAAELKLNQENMGRLEARQQGTEAKNQVTIRDLVRNALRMRPDRIIVGECRGEEALDMLQAMNTGHDGSLTTLHANSTRDAFSRLETMVLMAGVDLPLRAIREQIASSVNIVVQIGRLSDGTRKILEVAEVIGLEENTIQLQSIFKFERKWITEEGLVFGDVVSTGIVPNFLRGIPGNLEEKTKHLFATA